MKVTLDLDALRKAGKIDQAEYDRLVTLSKEAAEAHAFNVLMTLGGISVALGVVGLFPNFFASVMTAFVETVQRIFGTDGLYALVVLMALAGGTLARSGFLVGLAALIILKWLGGHTFYSHASYFVAVESPILTIVVFTLLGIGSFQLSQKLEPEFQRLAIIFSRTCVFIVNIGFWIGSVWGSAPQGGWIPAILFVLAWAAALAGFGAWGAREGRQWVVNTAAVFGSIHFYTQWFERLGASPGSLFLAGLMALFIAHKLRTYNRSFGKAA